MKLELATIKNIIFDLGGVILNLDLDASVENFKMLGLNSAIIDKKQAFSNEVFYEYQSGAITSNEFRERIRKLLKNPDATDEQINTAWGSMILDIPASRIETLRQLRKRFQVFLFSNTNDIHVNKLHQEFQREHGAEFSSLFNKVYYSHEIKDAKPAISSYLKVIVDSGVNPEETLFVDDLKKNIRGAEAAGLKGLWLQPGMEITEVFSES